ncbi:MAG: hypothetical protein A2297_02450 [Elusimicrobia bacterium RIFOXYB2_FULL_48_7]|nr:MAG: hypothetical protein A2297_02450 [Elusimicrobia bacterium RIFOXYB2_FULL_48_7]
MKKFLAVVAVVAGFSVAVAFAGDVTPIKLSLVGGVGVPMSEIVRGVDLGLISTRVQEVQGIQLGWWYAGTTEKMVGLQNGFVSSSYNKMVGIQWGFVCLAKDMNGVQVGVVNVADTMKGLQIGLLNVIKHGGFLPVMVVVNGKF